MKGSMEGLLPMLALFIMSIAMATQSIPLAEALGNIVGESTSDIERVVDARSYVDFYFHNYIPLAAQYAVNEASLELGHDGGGEDWNDDWLTDYNSNINQIEENLDDLASEKVTEAVDGSEGRNCEIPESDYSVSVYPTVFGDSFQEIRDHDTPLRVAHDLDFGTPYNPQFPEPEPIEVECDSGRTYYIDEGFFYSTETNATNNRYMQLADETVRFFHDLEEGLNDIDSESATKTACDSTRRSDAEEEAAEDLESNVESALSEIEEDYPERDEFEITTLEFSGSYNYLYGYNSDVLDASTSTNTNSYGSCNCDTCYETCYDAEGNPYNCNPYSCNCDSYIDTTATVSPEYLEINWIIEDVEQKIVVEQNHRNLEFNVEPYEHNW